MAESIKCNGSNNDDARNDFLNPVSEIQFGAAICYHSHDKRADDRTKNPSFTAVKARTANDHRGDHGEFEAICSRWITNGQVGKLQNSRHSGKGKAKNVDQDPRKRILS